MSFLQNMLAKQMMKRQMKGVPEAEQEKLLELITKNPSFFQNIAVEVDKKMKNEGKAQMAAVMEVMREHQAELQNMVGQK